MTCALLFVAHACHCVCCAVAISLSLFIILMICMYVCKYVCMYVCMYACMYISMYVYIYVCVCNPNLVYLQQYEEKVKDMKKHREGVADAKVKRVHKRREDKERQKQNIPEASLDMYVCACMDE